MINSVNYPLYYTPIFVEDHSNPEVKAIVKKINEELKIKQAYVKVEFIENTLKNPNLTKPQRFTLEYMLKDAQREFTMLKIQYKNKQEV